MRAPVAAAVALAAAVLAPAGPAGGREPFPGQASSAFAPASLVAAGPGGEKPFPRQAFSAFATGTAVHTAAAPAATGGAPLAATGVAVSGASAASEGLGPVVADELGQIVQPAGQAEAKSYARGAPLVFTAADGTPFESDPDGTGAAEAASPPSPAAASGEPAPVASGGVDTGSPLLTRTARAHTVWSDRSCVVGQPMSFGLGASGVDLHTAGSLTGYAFAAGAPTDATAAQARSRSFTFLMPNPDGTFALVSETRQTFAPVTVLVGTAGETTVALLGEWSLRATASGKAGGATVWYGPVAGRDPAGPVLRLVGPGGIAEYTFEELLAAGGNILPGPAPVEIMVGEAPRAIRRFGRTPEPAGVPGEAADGTRASAAVDVVRISVHPPATAGAPAPFDVRLGHMEVAATVPTGGIRCRIPIRKASDRDFVEPGERFTWTISIPASRDAFDGLSCDLADIRAVDTATGSPGVRFRVLSASGGGIIDGGTVTWDDLGRYHPGDPPIVVTVTGQVEPGGVAGTLMDTVEVTAHLDHCTGGAAGPASFRWRTGLPLRGAFTLHGPRRQVN